ncbi:hypothetical protein [Actinotalea fermentans]|uniref:Type VII secretion integral membrane protein EccD n=1 Tax=Actinotalea fermentans TaxID=43671 RepID=A0A511Z0B9_9CELL|nr:hypothetical protein [Actinotalea fermentans]GEN80904.1 hypothetical protein AFE02nite_26380 [Actinotalea fermentans]
MNPPARSRVALLVGERRVDVAIPAGTTLYDALRDVGVDLDAPGVAVVDSTGRALDRYGATGADLVDGAVLHVVRGSGSGRGAGRGLGRGARGDRRETAVEAPADPLASRPGGSAWWLGAAAAACVVALVVIAGGGLLAGDGLGDDTVTRWALVAGLGVAAAGLALLRGRPGTVGAAWPTLAAALAGAAGAAAAVDPGLTDAGRLMVLAGLVGALVPVTLRWAVGRRHRDAVADVAAPLALVLAVALVVVATTLLLDVPDVLAAAALLGAVPLGMRAVPVLSVSVPDSQLLDVSVVQRTATSVRAPEPQRPAEVNDRTVGRVVGSAERRQDAGTLALAAVAPLLAPVLLAGVEPGALTRWTAVGACVLVATALALAPRTARGGVVRWAPRAAAGAVVLELAAVAAGGVADLPAVAVVAALVLALGAVALSVPIGRGWRSVGFSRLADTVETLATVLALPVALVAGGVIEALRTLAS